VPDLGLPPGRSPPTVDGVRHIRTEDGVVHLPSPSNGDVGQPLCYEPSNRLPPRGTAVGTGAGATCAECHRRRVDEARAALRTAIDEAMAAGVDVPEATGRAIP
jgi:hypothetical protein